MSKPVHWSLIFVVLAMLSVTGCNTVRGVGQDVEAAGGALAGTAQKTEDKLSK